MVTRRLPPQQRRRVILAAAVEEFGSDGGGTLEGVARRAGVTKPLLYRHVTSRDELYAEVLDQEADALLAALGRTVPGAAGSGPARTRADAWIPREAVAAALDAFLEWVRTEPAAHGLLIRAPEAGPVAAAAHARTQARLNAALADALAADASLLPGDPDRARTLGLTAHVLRTAVNGLVAWWLEHPEVDAAEARDRALALLWPGLEELRR